MQDEYLRLLNAQMHVMLIWTIARERFGKGVHELTEEQSKQAQDMAYTQVRFFGALMTPERVKEMNSPLPKGLPPDKVN